MKIIIFIPVWKRPQLTAKCIKALSELRTPYTDLKIFATLSREDPAYYTNRLTMKLAKIPFGLAENYPVGYKKAAALKQAIEYYKDYDYAMEFGSDNFTVPGLFKLYEPIMSEGIKFFGLDNM